MEETDEFLVFSYGTLQDEPVQLACFGRCLVGWHDVIVGYALSSIEITTSGSVDGSRTTAYPILDPTGNVADEVVGRVFGLTAAELASADEYEGTEYRRIRVQLRSGSHAWVYARA